MMTPLLSQNNRNVSFDRTVRIESVPSLNEMSYEEQRASWFSTYEMGRMRSREKRRARDMSSAALDDALRHEIGLETKLEKQMSRSRVDILKYRVLLEQQRQWEEDSHDPDTLARIASATSMESMAVALGKAKIVEVQVRCEKERKDRMTELPLRRPKRWLCNNDDSMSSGSSNNSNQKWKVTTDNGFGLSSLPRSPRRMTSSSSNSSSSNQKWNEASSCSGDVGMSPPQRQTSMRNLGLSPPARRGSILNCGISPPERQTSIRNFEKKAYDLNKLGGLIGSVDIPSPRTSLTSATQ